MTVNWLSVSGLVCDFIGVLGLGLDAFIWTRAAPFDLFPDTPAATRFGFGMSRPLYRVRLWIYWLLVVVGFGLQLIGQFR